MATSSLVIQRPKRWDVSFDPEMSDSTVERLLQISPFRELNLGSFPKTKLLGILRHDTRLRRFDHGELIVREGDYGTSAFMVISGKARVVVSPDLPQSVLGRRVTSKKNIFRVIAQLWSNSREPEVRKLSELQPESGISARQDEAGSVQVFLQDVPRILNQHRTAQLKAGDFFGEIAALSRMPRTATVFAEGGTEMLEIRWQGLRDLMKGDETLKRHIDQIYRERALETHLRSIATFQHLSDVQLQKVMEQAEFETYGEYDWSRKYKELAKEGTAGISDKEPLIAQEGDYPNGIVLIRAGFARVSHRFGNGHRTFTYLGNGKMYGFEEIAHNWKNKAAPVPLQYSLRAIGYTHIIVIPTSVMEEVVLPSLPSRELRDIGPERFSARHEFPHAGKGVDTATMEFLTENRYFNGTASMVIDLERCTRCDDCVRACASTHDNNPRFLRHGPIHGSLMLANACMHCADPVCMIECPTGAIHRTFKGEVVVNQTTCIGCELCAKNCPYEAIRMVEIRDEKGSLLVDKSMKSIVKATKCDLCVEQYGGPACERACPHDALKRLNLTDLNTFAKWLKR